MKPKDIPYMLNYAQIKKESRYHRKRDILFFKVFVLDGCPVSTTSMKTEFASVWVELRLLSTPLDNRTPERPTTKLPCSQLSIPTVGWFLSFLTTGAIQV
ncbi:hypothetical protein AVEN_6654-1 [Araneus ventricosus]|uniref:Uncharacterized protein n=1 Tax=Araneus ventricosus TaxID=182803 RepID=A0A4Y2H143_ARAVE|nr:hypothetical protein AVEN_6654-1 [Araneus ventricosus]